MMLKGFNKIGSIGDGEGSMDGISLDDISIELIMSLGRWKYGWTNTLY